MFEEEEEPTFFEPQAFEAGDRVRINWSPECQLVPVPTSPMGTTGRYGHPSHEHGRTGLISWREPQEWLASQGHRYVVEFDEPIVVNGMACQTGHYAAIELEYEFPQPAAATGAGGGGR